MAGGSRGLGREDKIGSRGHDAWQQGERPRGGGGQLFSGNLQ